MREIVPNQPKTIGQIEALHATIFLTALGNKIENHLSIRRKFYCAPVKIIIVIWYILRN